MLKELFEISGHFERLCKTIAYSNVLPREKIKNLYHRIFQNKGKTTEIIPNAINDIYDYIKGLGINKGDILIVHSSMEGLKNAGVEPEEIIDFLLDLVGESGTLVIPTFPIQNLKYDPNKEIIYNPKRSLCWTGMIPNKFLKYPGVVRSSFPYNSLAALGSEAELMMSNNLEGDTPHGKNSSWYFCITHHAKILYLGVNIAECNTMLHVVEDYYDNEWPIKNWYETQNYSIKIGNEIIKKSIRVCDGKWVKYNICYNYNGKLKKAGLMNESTIDGVIVGYTPDSYSVFKKMLDEVKQGKIRYLIPKKYWKR